MLEKPRGAGELDVSPGVLAVLAELRARCGVDAPPEIDAERVREVESAFGQALHDDLLAVFAAGIPKFRDLYRMQITAVIGHTGDLRHRRARGDLIGVGEEERDLFLCVEKGAGDSSACTLVRYDATDKSREKIELEAWLRAELARISDGQPVDVADFHPKLTAFVPESTMQGRRVRHKKFGEGRAIRETGEGPLRKVQCDFPNWGLKLLQARFLEFLD